MRSGGEATYLVGLRLVPAAVIADAYPFNLPAVRTLDLGFRRRERDKSTVIEALAELYGYPAAGGGRNELGANHGPEPEAALATALRNTFAV